MLLIPVMQMFLKMVREAKHRLERLKDLMISHILLSNYYSELVGYENLQFSQGS